MEGLFSQSKVLILRNVYALLFNTFRGTFNFGRFIGIFFTRCDPRRRTNRDRRLKSLGGGGGGGGAARLSEAVLRNF